MRGTMLLKSLSVLVVLGVAAAAVQQSPQRWLGVQDRNLNTDGKAVEFALPNPGSGPTTLAIAADGTVWFTESSGNRIGKINPDGSGLMEYTLPNAGSSPRIIALGSDGNMWFSEHTGNRMGRITKDGVITEFSIPTANSMPRAIALGADGNIWFGEFAGSKIGRITP
jgi:virginiamycin B lyase